MYVAKKNQQTHYIFLFTLPIYYTNITKYITTIKTYVNIYAVNSLNMFPTCFIHLIIRRMLCLMEYLQECCIFKLNVCFYNVFFQNRDRPGPLLFFTQWEATPVNIYRERETQLMHPVLLFTVLLFDCFTEGEVSTSPN
jgi:hypothetical protein